MYPMDGAGGGLVSSERKRQESGVGVSRVCIREDLPEAVACSEACGTQRGGRRRGHPG